MTIEISMIDWDSKLLEALWAYCIAYKVTIRFTPAINLRPRSYFIGWIGTLNTMINVNEKGGNIIMKENSIQNDLHECDHHWEQECEERRDS